jgi:hypothetical protein
MQQLCRQLCAATSGPQSDDRVGRQALLALHQRAEGSFHLASKPVLLVATAGGEVEGGQIAMCLFTPETGALPMVRGRAGPTRRLAAARRRDSADTGSTGTPPLAKRSGPQPVTELGGALGRYMSSRTVTQSSRRDKIRLRVRASLDRIRGGVRRRVSTQQAERKLVVPRWFLARDCLERQFVS